ncbi:MAG: InlB B-repeat-containing protein, partial [Chitinispirillia bacterium]|nr:InlB B-repeat-containing protein [Chitinispirillia bacterium]
KWTIIEYTLTINSNPEVGGTITPSIGEHTYTVGTEVTVTVTPNAGYIFTGWSGESTSTRDTVIIIMNGDKALTAGFQIKRFMVTFDTDGGTPSMIIPVFVDSGKTLGTNFPPNPTKPAHTFEGWFDGDEPYDSSTIITEAVTLKAKFQMKQYTVRFDIDGGTPSTISPVSVDSGKIIGVNFPADLPTRTHHTFGGWFDEDDEQYNALTVITKDVTLKAKWTLNTYTLTINRSSDAGGLVAPMPGEYSHPAGTVVNISAIAATSPVYVFTGWTFTSTQATINDITSASATVTLNSDATVTANFVRQFTVTYSTNGGTGGAAPPAETVNEGSSITLASGSEFTKSGQVFVNWNTNAAGSGANHNAGATFTPTSDITLYARWGFLLTVNLFPSDTAGTVRFVDDGVDYTAPVPVLGGPDILIRATHNSGYTFRKWTTTGGAVFNNETSSAPTVTLSSNATITANFFGSVTHSGNSTKNYRTTKIGNQIWMAENLSYAASPGDGSWCYGNNDAEREANCPLYGRLYDWETAKTVCSGLGSGWDLPTDNDWIELAEFVGGVYNDEYRWWDGAGTILKTVQWNDNSWNNGTDDYGFRAMPGGYRIFTMGFPSAALGNNGYWWSATETEGSVSSWSMGTGSNLSVSNMSRQNWLSVRCVRND